MALGQHADDGRPVVFGPPLGVGGHPPAQAGTHGAAVAGLNQQQRLAQPPLGLQPVLHVGLHGGGNAQVRVAVVQVCQGVRRHVLQRRRLRPCQALRKVHQMLAILRAHGLGANHPALVHACLSQQGHQLLVEVAIPDRTRACLSQPLQQLAFLGAQPQRQLALGQQMDLAHIGLPLVERAHPASGGQQIHRCPVAGCQQPAHWLDEHQVAHGTEADEQGAGKEARRLGQHVKRGIGHEMAIAGGRGFGSGRFLLPAFWAGKPYGRELRLVNVRRTLGLTATGTSSCVDLR